MADFLLNLISLFTNNGKIITIIISMVPLIELKGAIPIGILMGENLVTSATLAYIGSTSISLLLFSLVFSLRDLLILYSMYEMQQLLS